MKTHEQIREEATSSWRSLIVMIAFIVGPHCAAFAQSAADRSIEEIMRGVIERRVAARAVPLFARINSVATVHVDNVGSRVALIPDQTVLAEVVATYWRQSPAGAHLHVEGIRESAPNAGIAASVVGNFRSLGDVFDLDDDEVVFLNTRIPSPLGAAALEHYIFQRTGSSVRNGVPVIEIEVRPRRRLLPGWEGRLFVSESSNDIVEMNLTPSASTAIPFVRQLRLVSRWSPVAGGNNQPESIEISGEGEVLIAAFGLARTHVRFVVDNRFQERGTTPPSADTRHLHSTRVVVADSAHIRNDQYWRTFGRMSAASVVTLDSSLRVFRDRSPVRFGLAPYIDYNRAGGATIGITPSLSFAGSSIGGTAAYSFGLGDPLGEATAVVSVPGLSPVGIALRGSIFSHLATFTTGDKSYPRIMNTLVAATLHQDYYDFYRKDGWSTGADITFGPLRLSGTLEQSRQFSLPNTSSWSLLTWTGTEFPTNPSIEEGAYSTIGAEIAWERVAPFLKITPIDDVDLRFSLSGLRGERAGADTTFELAEALVSLSIPVVRTGYVPMTLVLLGAGGVGTASLPPQYQFRLRTSAASFGKPGGLVSPPKGLYGGTEYLALGLEFNTTDLFWRAIGLPTYKGRGIELIVAGAGARYRQAHATGYLGTGDIWYTEAGIALSRIPLFVTDIAAGRVDLRMGFGPLGRFGGNFTFVVPL